MERVTLGKAGMMVDRHEENLKSLNPKCQQMEEAPPNMGSKSFAPRVAHADRLNPRCARHAGANAANFGPVTPCTRVWDEAWI